MEVNSDIMMEFTMNRRGSVLSAKGMMARSNEAVSMTVFEGKSLGIAVGKIFDRLADNNSLGEDGGILISVRKSGAEVKASPEKIVKELQKQTESISPLFYQFFSLLGIPGDRFFISVPVFLSFRRFRRVEYMCQENKHFMGEQRHGRKHEQSFPFPGIQTHRLKCRNQSRLFRHHKLQSKSNEYCSDHQRVPSMIHPKYRFFHVTHSDRMKKL